jgi:hypothetical protein
MTVAHQQVEVKSPGYLVDGLDSVAKWVAAKTGRSRRGRVSVFYLESDRLIDRPSRVVAVPTGCLA